MTMLSYSHVIIAGHFTALCKRAILPIRKERTDNEVAAPPIRGVSVGTKTNGAEGEP